MIAGRKRRAAARAKGAGAAPLPLSLPIPPSPPPPLTPPSSKWDFDLPPAEWMNPGGLFEDDGEYGVYGLELSPYFLLVDPPPGLF